MLEQADQRDCGICVPGGVQDSAGWGPEQSDLISLALSWGLEQMTSERPFLSKLLWFCGIFSFYSSKLHQNEKYLSLLGGCVWMVIGSHTEHLSNQEI